MAAKKDEYGNLIEPEMPVAIDNTAVRQANQGVTAAKDALDAMSYDNFKQGSMYDGLKKSYSQQGQQAMKDTIGQVAARTGGMASSWAATAGQQSYNNYMQQLEDVARSMYNDEYSRARDKVNLAQDEYNRAYGEYRDSYDDAWDAYDRDMQAYRYAVDDQRYDAEQSQKLQEKEENRVYSDAYYGNAPTYAEYKAAGGTLDERTYNSIVNAAQSEHREKTYDRTQGEKEQAQADCIAIWATGGTPTAEQLAAAGWADESAGASEDGTIPAGLSALGQAYYKQATAAPAEEEPEFRGVSGDDFEYYSSYFDGITTAKGAEAAAEAIIAATGNEDFAYALYEMWESSHGYATKGFPELDVPAALRIPKLN